MYTHNNRMDLLAEKRGMGRGGTAKTSFAATILWVSEKSRHAGISAMGWVLSQIKYTVGILASACQQ